MLASGPMGPTEGLCALAGPGVAPGANTVTGSADGVTGSLGAWEGKAALAGTSTASSGPARQEGWWPGTLSAGSEEQSEVTRPYGCYKCGKQGHYRVNCPEKVKTGAKSKKNMKRKRSGVSGQTPEGKQVKTDAPVTAETTKYRKPAFDWSQVTLVVLKKDGQPMSLEEYEEEKGNFVQKEVDLAMRDGSMIDIDDWSWFQDRVEVKFSNVASTESFRKLMVGYNIISKAKWEEEHMKLHHFTGKVDKATMKAPFKSLRFIQWVKGRSNACAVR